MHLYKYDNPLKNLPKDVLKDCFVKTGLDYEKEFNESLKCLQDSLASYNPLHLLSVLSLYGLFKGIETPRRSKKDDNRKQLEITQSHVELTQALLLTLPINKISLSPAKPQNVQDIWDSLIKISIAFSQKRLVQIQKVDTEQERAVLFLQECIRQHTQYVRNWGHYQQVVNTAKKLYAPLDYVFEEQLGIPASGIIELIETLISDMELKINEHRNRLRLVFKEKKTEDSVRKYYELFPDMKDSSKELLGFIRTNKIPIDGVRALILSHSDFNLLDFFTYSAEKFASKYKLDNQNLVNLFTKLSIKPGDLHDINPEFIFMDNPVWTKPFVKLSEDKYFCSIPQVFFSFVFEIMDGLLDRDKKIRDVIDNRRATFLEEAAHILFQKTFPTSKIIKNFKWREMGNQYENDLMVKVDSFLILVEAKSGRITKSALRGAPERLKQHIEELVFEPSIQSYRLFDKIQKSKTCPEKETDFLKQFPFDLNEIHKVVRLSVTLEDFATIQTNIMKVKKTGWFGGNTTVSPSFLFADLQVIFDMLTGSEVVHYLMRRTVLEEKALYQGDEMDLLGLYLDTGLNISDFEVGKINLIIMGLSKQIDDYYMALEHGQKNKKPKLKMTQWWSDIRRRIEQKVPGRWLETSVMLLNVSPSEQLNLARNFKSIKKQVRKNWQKSNHINSLVCLPPNWRDEAVALIAYRELNNDKRYNYINNLADDIFSKSHVQQCLIIGINIDRKEYPYSILSMHSRSKE